MIENAAINADGRIIGKFIGEEYFSVLILARPEQMLGISNLSWYSYDEFKRTLDKVSIRLIQAVVDTWKSYNGNGN